MFYDSIYLAKEFRMRPKVRSTLTHLSLESNKRDTGKQCRPRSDAMIMVNMACIQYSNISAKNDQCIQI